MSLLRIIRIHNELLGTYGDQGNAEVLAFRAKFHGIKTEILDISYPERIPLNGGIYLLGGAEDAAQILSLEANQKQNALLQAVNNGAVLMAVCAGFQIIGNSFYANGTKFEGLGLLNVDSQPGEKRYVGDIKIKSNILGIELTGFENHAGKTILGDGVEPFGKVMVGFGNGDKKFDGAVCGNVFGTYMHGPVLARNPEIADLLLCRATGRQYTKIEDPLATQYALLRRKIIK